MATVIGRQRTRTDAGKLTSKQVKAYVKSGGIKCPFCGAAAIEGQSIEVDGGSAYQDVSCTECNREWTDSYTLTGVI